MTPLNHSKLKKVFKPLNLVLIYRGITKCLSNIKFFTTAKLVNTPTFSVGPTEQVHLTDTFSISINEWQVSS